MTRPTGQPLNKTVAETIVINPPHLAHRRASSEALCSALGLTNARFSDGVSGHPHQLACTLAHRSAMTSASAFPCLILEDDLELAGTTTTLPPFPANADIIYLSVTPFGCLPWHYDNLAIARHQAIQGLTLASRHDDDWLRLHSMSGGQAILYVSEKGLEAWKSATFQAKRFGGAFDVFTAYAMNDVNVYAPHAPLLCESAQAQRDTLKQNPALLEKRLSFTRTPLKSFAAGDQTVVHFKGQTITVEAEQITQTALQWRVRQVEKPA